MSMPVNADAVVGPPVRETIMRIEPYVPGKPAEEVQRELGLTDVIKLASNESPIGPSPAAIAAVQAALGQMHVYPDGAALALREAIAQRHGLTVDHVAVGNGSDEIIKLLAEAYIEPGDEVVFGHPTFGEYAYATRLMGGTERPVPLQEMTYDLDALRAAITPRTKLVFVCNPNNPTGTYVGRAAVERFLQDIPAGVLVVFDEAYREYVEADDFPDTLAYVRQGKPVLVLRTFSKIYGLAALRVGYGIGSPSIVGSVLRVKEPFNVNALAQKAALAALADDEHVQRGRAVNREGMAYLSAELDRLGAKVWPSQANFLWTDVGTDSKAVFQSLLRRGVIVRSGDIFGFPTCLRVTVGTAADNRRFVAALEEVLDELRDADEERA